MNNEANDGALFYLMCDGVTGGTSPLASKLRRRTHFSADHPTRPLPGSVRQSSSQSNKNYEPYAKKRMKRDNETHNFTGCMGNHCYFKTFY